jgi:hypothetical protein
VRDNTCPVSLVGDNQGNALLGGDKDEQFIINFTPLIHGLSEK